MHANALDREYPENDEGTLYIRHGSGPWTLEELTETIEAYFPKLHPSCIEITSELIQERCFGYDLHDPSDYGKYFVVTRI